VIDHDAVRFGVLALSQQLVPLGLLVACHDKFRFDRRSGVGEIGNEPAQRIDRIAKLARKIVECGSWRLASAA